MRMITPNDTDYDDARELFNQAIDKRPAVIAKCANADDIADALTHAGEKGYEVAVRSGGHSVSGLSTNDGWLVIDVRPIDAIEVDAERRTIRVGGGVNWGAFDA